MDDDKKSSDHHVLQEVILASNVIAIVGGASGLYFFGSVFDRYRDILASLYGAWLNVRRTVEIIAIMISIGLIGFIISVLQRFFALREKERKDLLFPQGEGSSHIIPLEKETAANWQEIKALADSGNPSDWNMAVLRADALLETVLQQRGYEGETIAERLKIVDPSALPSLDRLWSAHRLRNMIAHDPLEQHTKETIIQALRSYEAALKDLKVLDEEKPQ